MDYKQFVSTVVGHLAWPFAILAIAFLLKEKLNAALDKLISLKYHGLQLTFADASKKIIQEKVSKKEKKELLRQQVVHETPNYKLYSNGSLVQHLRDIKIAPHLQSADLLFPISFPNELTDIQIIGDIDARVQKAWLGGCVISFSPVDRERQVSMILSVL